MNEVLQFESALTWQNLLELGGILILFWIIGFAAGFAYKVFRRVAYLGVS